MIKLSMTAYWFGALLSYGMIFAEVYGEYPTSDRSDYLEMLLMSMLFSLFSWAGVLAVVIVGSRKHFVKFF